MPSLYEPCGLSQLYAMRYGTIPIVRATGGLDDTVETWNPKTSTGYGFKFKEAAVSALIKAFDQALLVYQDSKSFQLLRKNAMQADFSWEKSAIAYEALYQSLQPQD